MKISVDISCGELIDKLSILEIKKQNISEESKLLEVNKEFKILNKIYETLKKENKNLEKYYIQLFNVNSSIWQIEDKIRKLESESSFQKEFIELARNVYLNNDKRFEIKNQINILFNSEIKEQKSYENYK
tara:strand:+ start:387 stop:776 length:390 start_codon:yes stop_codon:yes gene_type:complete